LKDTTVAARYARGLFLFTEKRGETARALEDLKGMLVVLAPGSAAGRFLASPVVLLAEKRRMLEQGFAGRALRGVVLFLDLLLRKKRMGEFPVVVSEFEALVEKSQGIQRAQVVSATPLVTAERDRLHRALEKLTSSTIRLEADVDPELLGGALVRIGDRVIDRSARTLLKAIAERLQHTSV
jgi:F-type H+-transporting ATPase subunit delta